MQDMGDLEGWMGARPHHSRTVPLRLPRPDTTGVTDAPTPAPIRPTAAAAPCNQSMMAFVRAKPELSVLAGHLEAAGAPLVGGAVGWGFGCRDGARP